MKLITTFITMRPAPLAIIILCCVVTNLKAQKTTQLPPKLEVLRESYQKARAKALDPIDRKYEQELQKLLTEATKSGDLDGALAIKTEIDSIMTKKTSEQAPQDEFIAKAISLKWTWGRPGRVTDWILMRPDGTGSFSAKREFKWERTGDREIRIYFTKEAFAKLTWNRNMKEYECVDVDGVQKLAGTIKPDQ